LVVVFLLSLALGVFLAAGGIVPPASFTASLKRWRHRSRASAPLGRGAGPDIAGPREPASCGAARRDDGCPSRRWPISHLRGV